MTSLISLTLDSSTPPQLQTPTHTLRLTLRNTAPAPPLALTVLQHPRENLRSRAQRAKIMDSRRSSSTRRLSYKVGLGRRVLGSEVRGLESHAASVAAAAGGVAVVGSRSRGAAVGGSCGAGEAGCLGIGLVLVWGGDEARGGGGRGGGGV